MIRPPDDLDAADSGPSFDGSHSSLRSYLAAFTLCLTILVVRGWERLTNAHLWAEDGKIYLSDALSAPWVSVIEQFGGYLQVFQRLVVQVLALLPLEWIPTAVALTCFALYAAFAAQFARHAFRDYVGSDAARIVAAGLLCFLPGMKEVAGNFAGLARPIFLFTWLLALKPPRFGFRRWELGALSLLAFSAAQTVAVLPMLALRLVLQLRSKAPASTLRREGLAIALIAVAALVNSFQPAHRPQQEPPALAESARVTLSFLPSVVVYQPLLGPDLTRKLDPMHSPGALAFGGAVILAMGWVLLRKERPAGLQLALGVAAAHALWPLTLHARPNVAEFIEKASTTEFFWNMRYGHQMAPYAVILWMGLFAPRHLFKGRTAVLALAFAALFLWNHEAYSRIGAYGTALDWSSGAEQLREAIATGCPPEVRVPIYPARRGWWVRYQGATERCVAHLTGSDPIAARERGRAGSSPLMAAKLLEATADAPASVQGWAIDRAATSGAGAEAVRAWALPGAGGDPLFLGEARLDVERPDVANAYGARFVESGYRLEIGGLDPGTYTLFVASRSSVTGTFNTSKTLALTVPATGPPPGDGG